MRTFIGFTFTGRNFLVGLVAFVALFVAMAYVNDADRHAAKPAHAAKAKRHHSKVR